MVRGHCEAKGRIRSGKPCHAQSGCVEKNSSASGHSISCKEGSCRFPLWGLGKDGTGGLGCDPVVLAVRRTVFLLLSAPGWGL